MRVPEQLFAQRFERPGRVLVISSSLFIHRSRFVPEQLPRLRVLLLAREVVRGSVQDALVELAGPIMPADKFLRL